MSLIFYATKVMNLYCGFQLTWKTCEAFKQTNEDAGDQLLIKWFLLYLFIQLEPMVFLILELIPFGFLFPFFCKMYILMPHSIWHTKIIALFEKLEMDEYSSQLLVYLSKGVKLITIKTLSIIETYIDIVRVDDLPEVESRVHSILDRILTKKQSIEVKQSKFRPRKSEPHKVEEKKLVVLASVQDQQKFVDYTLSYDCTTSELQFIKNNLVVHTRTLLVIDLNEDKCLRATYQENDGNLSLMKLKRSEDVSLWLTHVIDSLIERATPQIQI